jgi:hypothetical protein
VSPFGGILSCRSTIQVARALAALAELSPEQAQRVLKIARAKIAKAENQDQAEPLARLIGNLLQLRSPAEHVTGVVEILKYPTTAGRPTEILLDGLRKRFSDAPSGSLRDTQGSRIRVCGPMLGVVSRRTASPMP